ncbi:hypothetical protein OG455_27835 [Kitasatospora sp. NBC_01287]|uniref:hypothetical protein n=1 Tax=Kitasatospora sp. NBC_01287 TaxID=2903573 RepID=UPI00225AB5BE|nr:hypothetical protein [Kitasatospora sp. NBC_01287]MCX4749273.1 hypothetical protein [Kitasatospora sp. NBC_01287]
MTIAGIIEIRGPEHHKLTILEAITSTENIGPGTIAVAFGMVEHAITTAWALRPDTYRALAFRQFHDVVRDRYYADLYRCALDLRADMDKVATLAGDVTFALVSDPQLNR